MRYDCYFQNEDYYKRHGNYDEGFRFNPKFNIPEFDGRMDPDEFLDWLNMVEHVFEYYDSPEREKVKLVATKVCKNASIWWKNMKRQRERYCKKKIQTWGKMKKELKRKYLPFNYRQDIYLKIQNFKQRDLSVEEYSTKFVNLIIKGDLQEAEEICIAHHYIAGLRSGVARVIFLQPCNSLQDVMKLALKVGTKKKYGNSFFFFFWIIKNLLPKGKNPHQQKTNKQPKATGKNEKRTTPPLKLRGRGISPDKDYLITNNKNKDQQPTARAQAQNTA